MIKSTILTVYTDNSHTLYEDIDEVLIHGIATLDVIDHVKFVLKQISNKPEIAIIKHDVHAIMEKICSLCNENDVNFKLIIIIGHNSPYLSCKSFKNDIAKMIDKIVDAQNVKKYAPIINKMNAQLEDKHHRVICGIRKNTLIVNLFDLHEEVLTCHNIIVRTLQQQINLKIELKNKCETKLKKQQNVAKLANTLISQIIPTNQTDENKIKKMKDEENNMTKDTDSSILLNIDVANENTMQEFSSLLKPVKTLLITSNKSDMDDMTSSSLSESSMEDSDQRAIFKCSLNISNQAANEKPSSLNKESSDSKDDNKESSSSKDDLNISNQAANEGPSSLNKESSGGEDNNKESSLSKDNLNISNKSDMDDMTSSSLSESSMEDSYQHVIIKCSLSISNQAANEKPSSLNKESSDSKDDNKESSLSKDDLNISNQAANEGPSSLNKESSDGEDDNKESSSSKDNLNISNQAANEEPSSLNKESSDGGGDNKESSSSENNTQVKDIVPNTKFSMISLYEAFYIIQKVIECNISERQYNIVNINNAYGRILCQSIYSNCDVPAFRVSTKHGFAVLASDGLGPRIVLNKTTNTPVSLEAGTCVWVKSGDRIPEEATAVVPVKDAQQIIIKNKNKNKVIMIKIKPKYGQNIKDIGSDIEKNEQIINSFTRIGPAELGLLTALGYKEVIVARRVTVGILSIGDLLVEPSNSLTDGYVYDSNRISIIGLLKDKGFDSILDCGIVADNTLLIMIKIKEALKKVDVLVTIGCASNNDRLKRIFTSHFNATIHFGNVNIKPGKSTTFGTFKWENVTKYFLCLSKNPVTTLITAHLYLIPLLNGLHRIWKTPEKISVKLDARYILHERPRVIWATLRWNDEDNFMKAFSRKNFMINKPHSNQSANALVVLPQKEIDFKVMSPSYVDAFAINISSY